MENREFSINEDNLKKKGNGCCGVLAIVFVIFFVIPAIIGFFTSISHRKQTKQETRTEQKTRTVEPAPTPISPQSNSPMKSNTAPEPKSKQSLNPELEAPSAPKQAKDDSTTPWEQFHDELDILREQFEQEIREDLPFSAPQVGDEVVFRIDEGKRMKGKIYRLTHQNIQLGSEDSLKTLNWDRLVKADRLRLDRSFYENYVKEQALIPAKARLKAIVKEKKRMEDQIAKIKAEQAKIKAEQEAIKQRRKNIQKFRNELVHQGDGSVIPLVKAVKLNMNDPSSFEHVKSNWHLINGTPDQFMVSMTFRGKNDYGAKVLNMVIAVCRVDGMVLSFEYVNP